MSIRLLAANWPNQTNTNQDEQALRCSVRYGEPTLFSDEAGLREILHQMINTFESSYMAQWSELGSEYQSRMMKHIVGFEIKVNRLEAKFKLSQNRTKGEQSRVMQSLHESKDSNISGVADLMQQEGLGR